MGAIRQFPWFLVLAVVSLLLPALARPLLT